MHRVATTLALLALSGFSLALAGCSSDDGFHDHGGQGYDGEDRCSGITTCGACTPVVGCGWCSYEDGTGACATSAASCAGSTFRWNWEPSGCPASTVDAGPTSDAPADSSHKSDASTDAPVSDAPTNDGPNESASEAGDDSTPVDAPAPVCNVPTSGLNGCVSTTGGTLCGATQYTVACHPSGGSTPSPDASLKCTLNVSDPSGSYYCCPCTVGG